LAVGGRWPAGGGRVTWPGGLEDELRTMRARLGGGQPLLARWNRSAATPLGIRGDHAAGGSVSPVADPEGRVRVGTTRAEGPPAAVKA
jgi:hypothetical protein